MKTKKKKRYYDFHTYFNCLIFDNTILIKYYRSVLKTRTKGTFSKSVVLKSVNTKVQNNLNRLWEYIK